MSYICHICLIFRYLNWEHRHCLRDANQRSLWNHNSWRDGRSDLIPSPKLTPSVLSATATASEQKVETLETLIVTLGWKKMSGYHFQKWNMSERSQESMNIMNYLFHVGTRTCSLSSLVALSFSTSLELQDLQAGPVDSGTWATIRTTDVWQCISRQIDIYISISGSKSLYLISCNHIYTSLYVCNCVYKRRDIPYILIQWAVSLVLRRTPCREG